MTREEVLNTIADYCYEMMLEMIGTDADKIKVRLTASDLAEKASGFGADAVEEVRLNLINSYFAD